MRTTGPAALQILSGPSSLTNRPLRPIPIPRPLTRHQKTASWATTTQPNAFHDHCREDVTDFPGVQDLHYFGASRGLTNTKRLNMKPLLPELRNDGLLLWRLCRSETEHLWCAVGRVGDEFLLVVRDPATRWTSVAETHAGTRSLVRRATGLRRQLLAGGWHPVGREQADTVH